MDPICPFCEKGYEKGDRLLQVVEVIQPASSILTSSDSRVIQGPGSRQMQAMAGLAHISCLLSAEITDLEEAVAQ